MRRNVSEAFQMAALPWANCNSLLNRELGINLDGFRADMLDWRNNKWSDSPAKPAAGWLDNVQDAIDALAGRVAMMGGGIRNLMDVDKEEMNNMALCGTVTTAIWRSPSRQEWASTFHKPWYPRNSAIFGSGHDIFKGENLLVSGEGNLIDNNAYAETAYMTSPCTGIIDICAHYS